MCGCYGVYVTIKECVWLLRGVRGNHGMCVAVTGCMWQSRNVCGCYGMYVANVWSSHVQCVRATGVCGC